METNKQNTALLVMDMQIGILKTVQDPGPVIEKVEMAIAYARKHQIPVIYVVVRFRQGLPEVGTNNKNLSILKDTLANVDLQEWSTVLPSLGPIQDEPIVQKCRVSAFSGSDLEVILRAKGIQHLVLTGFATSGVVLSTTREAADKDYRITILSDACGDRDEEVHRVLTTKVFPRQAEVMTVEEWMK